MTADIRTDSRGTTERRLELLGIPLDVRVGVIAYVEALNAKQLEDAQRFPHQITGYYSIEGGTDAGTAARENLRANATVADLNTWFDVQPDATGGGKFVRIVRMSSEYSTVRATSVHSILVKADGRIAKAAGWKGGPVKSTAAGTRGQIISKYNVADEASLAKLIADLDTVGSYLYQR